MGEGVYVKGDKIYESARSLICKGTDKPSNRKVILKTLRNEYPSAREIEALRYEYEIGKKLAEVPGVIRYLDLYKEGNSYTIVMEDIEGKELSVQIRKGIPIKSFLDIAIRLAEAVAGIHKMGVIHKDINPRNIIINDSCQDVRITDFGIASLLRREDQKAIHPSDLEGTLLYISPEQTGRMNRPLDYRTDYYSLGATFYEMLTGQPPFQAEEPMELVHAHIAKKPPPLWSVKADIPETLSNIIIKLLSKNAEDRYQSSNGLLADLNNCRRMLSETGKIGNFEIGDKDFSSRFQISQKLYGREKETLELVEDFLTVCEGSKVVLGVSGHSGIGKTALIHEIYKPLIRERGYFISGKHDQLKANIPYFGLVLALRELVKELLSESEGSLRDWKDAILEALGTNAGVITEFFPEIEGVIGTQIRPQELPVQESQNRFQTVFLKFLGVFARKTHPLVIFLDDLQWADSSTLNLLEFMVMRPELSYLFLILSYRDNEVRGSHPVSIMLKDIREKGADYREISLEPLIQADVGEMVQDTLRDDSGGSKPFSELIYTKTKGNPFFTVELLKKMHDESIIRFEEENGRWEWDLEQAKQLSISENVVDLMIEKIGRFRAEVQTILQAAACLGDRFDISTLSAVLKQEGREVYRGIMEAVKEEVVAPSDTDYRYGENQNTSYRFVHDRIRQAAYTMLEEQRKKEVHYSAGLYLLKTATDGEKLEDGIFDIANHMNMAGELVAGSDGVDKLICFNTLAAKKAKASSAFQASLDYVHAALSLLGEDAWEKRYQELYDLNLMKGECLYLTMKFEEADEVFRELLKKSRNRMERADIYGTQAMLYNVLGRYGESIEYGAKGLKELGFKVPLGNAFPAMMVEIVKSKIYLSGRSIDSLATMPEMKDERKLQVIKIAANMLPSAFMSGNTYLWAWLIVVAANITFREGNSKLASSVYVYYGSVLSGGLEDYGGSFRFGQLAMQISRKYGDPATMGADSFVFTQFISQWGQNYRLSKELYIRAFKHLMEGGNPTIAGYAIANYLYPMIHTGDPISKIIEESLVLKAFVNTTGDPTIKMGYMPLYHSILCLAGKTKGPTDLSDEEWEEKQGMLKVLEMKNYQVYCITQTTKMTILGLFWEWDKVLELSDNLKPYLAVLKGVFNYAEFMFYSALAILRLMGQFTGAVRRRRTKELKGYMTKMKNWAELSPENFSQRYYLLQAETARLSGNTRAAMERYHMAVEAAAKHEHINIEALANELLGSYYLELGATYETEHYLRNALICYQRWEVSAKEADFRKKYGKYLVVETAKSIGTAHTVRGTISQTVGLNISETFDLGSIIKATQAISQELDLGGLLEKAMQILLENAGAQKGAIILKEGGGYAIQGQLDVSSGIKAYLQNIPVEQSDFLSVKIVSYVLRSREDVVLNRAGSEEVFRDDSYVNRNKPKSILCIPIMRQGECAGALYLENGLAEGAFTEERLAVLRVLAGQIAVSVENVRLIGQLREKERLKKEMEIAERIQTSLIPKDMSDKELEICGIMKPTEKVGGDYYDFQRDIAGELWFSIGDVSGHGVTPGLIMMMAQTAFLSEVKRSGGLSPAYAMKAVNAVLYENIRKRLGESYFMTMILVKHKGKGLFSFAGAGHTEMVVYREASGNCETISAGGVYLSVEEDISDYIMEKELKLSTGDILFLYTDGIIESRKSGNGPVWGMENFLKSIVRNASCKKACEMRNKILQEASDWCDNKLRDDMTLVVIKKTVW